jgi:cysteine desulfurase
MTTAKPTPPASIYLAHAATTPVRPEVADVVDETQRRLFGNPSSQHAAGRAARRALEDARDRILELVGCRGGRAGGAADRDRLVFTSGASEANHLAIEGMAAVATAPGTVSYSRRDHASVVQAAAAVGGRGWRLEELGLDADGRIRAASIEPQAGPWIVVATLVCGQTGVIEDMTAVAGSVPRALIHCDATQAAGLLPIVVPALRVATLTLAPHKFGGPRGIGGLVIRGGVAVAPLQTGTQQEGLRGGTEPVALAVGFARALELAAAERDAEARRLAGLRDRFEAGLLAACREAGIPAVVVASAADRSPHISTVSFPGRDRQALSMAADLAGVCLATGTACASGSSEPAPALMAMGLPPEVVRGAVRCSFGRSTTAEDVDLAIDRLAGVARG